MAFIARKPFEASKQVTRSSGFFVLPRGKGEGRWLEVP
jgi:hypothetical protein